MKFNKAFLVLPLLGMSLLQVANTALAIEVFPIVKEVKSENPRDNFITVRSIFTAKDSDKEDKSESRQFEFVTMELFRITNPGADIENLEKELGKTDPVLMYSPTRLVVPYGEARKVRLMPLKPVTHEQIYRLRIRPSYPEESLSDGKVRFAIGYDVLLRYLPDGERTQGLDIQCAKGLWTVTATGNVRSEMRNLVIDGRKDAVNFNVYPDSPRSLKVNTHLVFEMDKKLYTYENCSLKG